jgi:Rps23 Pro-64 3,4-dihydroxylase Tpa1-like proline 4-hydroxylase
MLTPPATDTPITPLFFDPEKLQALASSKRDAYASAKPYPHIVMDDFLPEDALRQVLAEFPDPKAKDVEWRQFDNEREKKLAANRDATFGPFTRHLLSQFNSAVFLEFLETLTGIEGLIPDPHYVGGGLHQIERGGMLKVHADFNWHQRLLLDRRINLLLYLNEDWQEEYGGHFELWDASMTRSEKQVLPVFNRCVVFSTTSESFHGHPNPLTCPEDRTRKSLALYYYTNGRPANEVSDSHDTLFQARPGEVLSRDKANAASTASTREKVKQFIPPIVIDVARDIRARRAANKK